MHDSLGLHLSALLKRLQHGLTSSATIQKEIQEALDQMRLLVDSLEDVGGDILTVLGNLRYRLTPRLAEAGIRVEWCVADVPELPWLNAEKNLHIQQESAKTVATSISDTSEQAEFILISIIDNGKGFNLQKTHYGNGLRNMHFRALQVGGELNITSNTKGTTVELRLPVVQNEGGLNNLNPRHISARWTLIFISANGNSQQSGQLAQNEIYESGAARNLFGGSAQAQKSNISILGLIADNENEKNQESGRGSAILVVNNQTSKAYKEGTTIATGVTLTKIYAKSIVLSQNGKDETIKLPEKNNAAISAGLSTPNIPNLLSKNPQRGVMIGNQNDAIAKDNTRNRNRNNFAANIPSLLNSNAANNANLNSASRNNAVDSNLNGQPNNLNNNIVNTPNVPTAATQNPSPIETEVETNLTTKKNEEVENNQ
ncbi:hypothetical protein ACTFIZ_007548 [Dictyostelium cf. discoideum]